MNNFNFQHKHSSQFICKNKMPRGKPNYLTAHNYNAPPYQHFFPPPVPAPLTVDPAVYFLLEENKRLRRLIDRKNRAFKRFSRCKHSKRQFVPRKSSTQLVINSPVSPRKFFTPLESIHFNFTPRSVICTPKNALKVAFSPTTEQKEILIAEEMADNDTKCPPTPVWVKRGGSGNAAAARVSEVKYSESFSRDKISNFCSDDINKRKENRKEIHGVEQCVE